MRNFREWGWFRIIGYWGERFYPYFIAIVVYIFTEKYNINYISSENIQDALDSIMNMTSLILGFGGALIPIVIGLKGESEFIRRILDNNKLFFKYFREMIMGGLLLIAITISIYFVNDIDNEFLYNHAFKVWISMIVVFIMQTYRSIMAMLKMIFYSGRTIQQNPEDIIPAESELERENRNNHIE